MIQLYYGDGKGKTTAAVGAAVRAAGRERRIIFAQFMKSGESGELFILSKLSSVRILRSGEKFPFFREMSEAQKQVLSAIHNEMLEEILKALEENCADFVILDEITHACRFGLLSVTLLSRILSYGKGQEVEIILTGRKPTKELFSCSDYRSEICCRKHPYEKGVKARFGIEY